MCIRDRIRTALDCDMIEVEPQMPYENDYNAMLERAQEELAAIEQGRYPAVGTSVDSFDGYDIVFVGYPIWYGSMATPMQALDVYKRQPFVSTSRCIRWYSL